MDFRHLDSRTRQLMLEELEYDMQREKLYYSTRLTDRGRSEWPSLLREAIENGNDISLAQALRQRRCLKSYERRKGRLVKVPVTAAEMLAEGEFNRFYIRALCRRALEEGVPYLQIYRAKPVLNPRPESIAREGKLISPADLLKDLREHPGVDTALGVPAGPNSGLSVCLPTGFAFREPA